MKKGLIGRKLGMTQIFDEKGKVIPVTVINAGPCVVVQKRTNEKNGYEAVQLGFSDIAERKLNKPEKGVFEKAQVSFKKYLKEFRLDDCSALNVGDVLTADTFEVGEKVDITGITKGRGYSGVIKRWGCHRLRMTHGTGPVHRQAGPAGSQMGMVIRTEEHVEHAVPPRSNAEETAHVPSVPLRRRTASRASSDRCTRRPCRRACCRRRSRRSA